MTPSTRRHGAGARKHAASEATRQQSSERAPAAEVPSAPRRARSALTLPSWLRTRPSWLRKAPTRRMLIIAGTTAAIVVVAAVLIVAFVTRPSVRVPSLVGVARVEAENRAKALGLTVTVKGTEFSAEVPKGAIASQDPTAGALVGPGTAMTLLVSAGSETFALPDVVGMTLAEARTALRTKGLEVQYVSAPSDAPTGTVTASAPAAGTEVLNGDVVRLTISASGGAVVSASLADVSFVIDPAPPIGSASLDPAFDVATRLSETLRLAGAAVTMTRDTRGQAGAPGVDARLQAARESSATVFIGLSVAASGLEGLEVLVMPTTGVTSAVSAASGPLADAVFASLRVENSAVSTITATADKVMTGAGTAGVGVRLGSFGARTDRKLFSSAAWADTMARAIGRALSALYGSNL